MFLIIINIFLNNEDGGLFYQTRKIKAVTKRCLRKDQKVRNEENCFGLVIGRW